VLNSNCSDLNDVYSKFREVVRIRKNKVFVKELVRWILSNRDRVKRMLEELFEFLYSNAERYYGRILMLMMSFRMYS